MKTLLLPKNLANEKRGGLCKNPHAIVLRRNAPPLVRAQKKLTHTFGSLFWANGLQNGTEIRTEMIRPRLSTQRSRAQAGLFAVMAASGDKPTQGQCPSPSHGGQARLEQSGGTFGGHPAPICPPNAPICPQKAPTLPCPWDG